MAEVAVRGEDPFPLRLIRANEQLMRAADEGPDQLAKALGVAVAAGWPEFPEAIAATLEFLRLFPEQADWSTYFFVNEPRGVLVGSGGFKGKPVDGMVEIGYEVAPGWRNRGAATEAVTQFIGLARRSGLVTVVAAETFPEWNASAAVLRGLGFRRVRSDSPGPDEVWRWERACMP